MGGVRAIGAVGVLAFGCSHSTTLGTYDGYIHHDRILKNDGHHVYFEDSEYRVMAVQSDAITEVEHPGTPRWPSAQDSWPWPPGSRERGARAL